jgi:hypothetical protein
MYRNATGQYVSFLMVSVEDGSGVTGLSPAVWVTKDGGSQTAGAGTVSELGNGQYRYLFTQAETNAGTVMLLATGAGAIHVSLTAYPEDAAVARAANVTQIDGQATSGNNATLNLKQINVVNSAGTAIVAESTGGNGRGIHATGNGTGSGMRLTGGATGHGLNANGGSTSGSGCVLTATDGIALDVISHSNDGVRFQAAYSGGVGSGIRAQSFSGQGLTIVGSTTGLAITPGATGTGVVINGGSTSGGGIRILTTNGHGLEIAAAGSGKHDIVADDWGGEDVAAGLGEIGENMEGLEGILAGPGTEPVTLVVREPEEGAVIADAEVWLTMSGGSATPAVARGRTNVSGEVRFMLELGQTYYLWAVKVGMNPIMGEGFVAE